VFYYIINNFILSGEAANMNEMAAKPPIQDAEAVNA